MMKKTIVLLYWIALGWISLLPAQEMIYTQVDQMPYFPSCDDYTNGSDEKRQCSNLALVTYLSENLRYPDSAKEEGVEGTVLVSFVIDERGKVLEPSIIRDIGGGCGEVALSIVRNMPAWEPGVQEEQTVKVKLNLPIQFAFKDQNDDKAEKFTLHWGQLKRNKISKTELIEIFDQPITIRDQFGDEVSITELAFTFERKKAFYDERSAGTITPEVRKILKKVKKGGVFGLVATIQEKGQFIYVRKTYDITD